MQLHILFISDNLNKNRFIVQLVLWSNMIDINTVNIKSKFQQLKLKMFNFIIQ